MMVRNNIESDSDHFNCEKRNNNLSEWIKENQIELVLFDLDETIIETSKLFETQKKIYINHLLSGITGYSFEHLLSQLEEIDEDYFNKNGVNPERWGNVVQKMAEDLDISKTELFLSGLPILLQIYKETPRIIEGATETLDSFLYTGVNMGLVTHANREWTEFKLTTLGLNKYFSNIIIADENKHKDSEDWIKAIQTSGFSPSNTMVIGDSLESDIKASANIGVKKLIWINNNEMTTDLPKNTTIIPDISKLIPTLCD